MLIKELGQHCGECPLIDFCASPYASPCLCKEKEVLDMLPKKYLELADSITYAEYHSMRRKYEEEGGSPWTDLEAPEVDEDEDHNDMVGTIFDCVLARLGDEAERRSTDGK